MPCQMCRERGKTWEGGDDPKCAFEGDRFSADNWNCATANALRDVIGELWDSPRPDVITLAFCGDQKYATVPVYDLGDWSEYALWVTWYKRRGRTDAMWMLGEDGPPRPPTEAECRAIIAFFTETRADAQKGASR